MLRNSNSDHWFFSFVNLIHSTSQTLYRYTKGLIAKSIWWSTHNELFLIDKKSAPMTYLLDPGQVTKFTFRMLLASRNGYFYISVGWNQIHSQKVRFFYWSQKIGIESISDKVVAIHYTWRATKSNWNLYKTLSNQS